MPRFTGVYSQGPCHSLCLRGSKLQCNYALECQLRASTETLRARFEVQYSKVAGSLPPVQIRDKALHSPVDSGRGAPQPFRFTWREQISKAVAFSPMGGIGYECTLGKCGLKNCKISASLHPGFIMWQYNVERTETLVLNQHLESLE